MAASYRGLDLNPNKLADMARPKRSLRMVFAALCALIGRYRGLLVFICLLGISIVGCNTSVTKTGDDSNAARDFRLDCEMTLADALDGVPESCPREILESLRLVDVEYFSFDGKRHIGQIVVHEDLVSDVKYVFDAALSEQFSIGSVIPVSDLRFRKDGLWDDELSMAANNSSAFNFRPMTGGKKLSNHSYGRAVDINPRLNPYVKGDVTLPEGSKYDPQVPGTLTEESAITKAFLERGWEWGGHWTTLKDYQHFEKVGAK